MQTFKEYLLIEKAEILSRGLGPDMAISVNSRNINTAKIELIKLVQSNKKISPTISRDDINNEIKYLRGLYDIKSNIFYVWFSYEAVHNDIIKRLNLNNNNNIHLSFIGMRKETKASPEGALRGFIINQHSIEEINNWKDVIIKFVGRVMPLNTSMFEVYGRQ